MNGHSERQDSLWILVVSPTIWAIHLVLSYATAAVWCAKLGEGGGSFMAVRLAIGAYTAVALLGIGVTGLIGWRRHRSGGRAAPHGGDTVAGRHRFLGFATLLLSGLSGVATAYAALAAVFIAGCE